MTNSSPRATSTPASKSRRASYRSRRIASVAALTAVALGFIFANPGSYEPTDDPVSATAPDHNASAEETPPISNPSDNTAPTGPPLQIHLSPSTFSNSSL